MTKEQELAKEAGFDLNGMPNMLYTVRGNHAQLERLIKLVRNAALEEAAQEFRGLYPLDGDQVANTLLLMQEPTP